MVVVEASSSMVMSLTGRYISMSIWSFVRSVYKVCMYFGAPFRCESATWPASRERPLGPIGARAPPPQSGEGYLFVWPDKSTYSSARIGEWPGNAWGRSESNFGQVSNKCEYEEAEVGQK